MKRLKRTLGRPTLWRWYWAIIGWGCKNSCCWWPGRWSGCNTFFYCKAAIGCAFAGLCYAEFASMIPLQAVIRLQYATMGRTGGMDHWMGTDLEYALGAATVSIAWSEYLNKYLGTNSLWMVPSRPFESFTDSAVASWPASTHRHWLIPFAEHLLIKGTQESAIVNNYVIVKVAIVLII